MEYIQRLPFILGGLAAFITGLITYLNKTSQQEAYIDMTFALFLFFIIGLYIRGIMKGIVHELEIKKKQEEEEEKKRLALEQAEAEEEMRRLAELEESKGGNIDIKVEDQ